jgi:hypothetical protein
LVASMARARELPAGRKALGLDRLVVGEVSPK